MGSAKRGDFYLRFPDGTALPDPTDPNEVEWRLRYQPDRGAELTAAAYMAAYSLLVGMSRRQREAFIRKIKAALKARAVHR